MFIDRKFPNTRLRRLRRNTNLIDLVAETTLTQNDLIQPIFIKENLSGIENIESMPNIFRYGVDEALKEIEDITSSGINSIAVFPVIDPKNKDSKGSEAIKNNNFISTSIEAIKKQFPDIVLIADVALDPYTDHGHDGIIIDGQVDNDETIKLLIEQSLILAESGADIIAPSDMMDGRIGYIRQAFEKNNFKNTILLSYAAKFSSKFYGPFRDAVGSSDNIKGGNKFSYQMDPANVDEALHECALDLDEGADMIMVKPGMPYLDVVCRVKKELQAPTFAYQVSGEYSMHMAAFLEGWLDKEHVMLESLLAFKRAGCDGILTYFALDAARSLQK